MKTRYNLDQQFFVTFAINSRKEACHPFELSTIRTQTLGLHDTIALAPHHELSEGEVAQALQDSLHSIYSDETYSHVLVSIINWWAI